MPDASVTGAFRSVKIAGCASKPVNFSAVSGSYGPVASELSDENSLKHVRALPLSSQVRIMPGCEAQAKAVPLGSEPAGGEVAFRMEPITSCVAASANCLLELPPA